MDNRRISFLIPSACVLFALLLPIVLFFNKAQVVLFVNKYHCPSLDIFFKNLSKIGDGFSIAVVAIVTVLFFKLRYFFHFLLSSLIHLIFVMLFKKVLFNGSPRPITYFKENNITSVLNFVEGVKVHTHNTFPSGHTTTIFFIAAFLAIWIVNKRITVVLLLFALLVGISRVYLVQHFFTDVYFGAIFGTISSITAYIIVSKLNKSWFEKKLIYTKPSVPLWRKLA